ncbi:ABC transporter permease [Ferruginibacter sp.]|nr:FtsX-like permease family protein [Ferruginibacter sp.]
MIKNYFKIAWRSLFKSKGSSFINIFGLAIGMAVAMLIGFWIYDEFSFNQYHKNYSRIAVAMQYQTGNGTIYAGRAIPFPLGDELKSKHGSDFKYLVMSSWEGEHILSVGEQKVSQSGAYMDEDAAKMLTLKMLKGSDNGLKDPNSILLSASAAKAVFGTADPINQLIKIDNKQDVKVTGVYEDIAYNTKFRDLMFIAPWKLYVATQEWVKNSYTQWGNNSFQLYVQIANNTDFASVNKRIINTKLDKVKPEEKKFNAQIFLHPMQDWHLRSNWENGKRTGGLIDYVWLFLMIGIFVLLLACINFMNLSTARSEKRAKEVGIRKAIGSLRSQLIGQFFSESLLVVGFAFLLSLLLTQLTMPLFNDMASKKMTMLWFNPMFWLMSIGFALFTGIVAGSYPALYLSSFQPVKVLKGTFRVGRFAAIPRKVLVVVQFTVSVTLIIGTIIVYRQIQYSKDRPVGYDRNALMMVPMKTPEFENKLELLQKDLVGNGAITQIAESSSPITEVWSSNGGMSWPGKDPNQDTDFATVWVSHDFGKTVGWQFTQGRDFARDFLTDSAGIVINEASVKFMNIKEPVGMQIKWGEGEHARLYTIIGVIKDMLMESPYEPVKQAMYLLNKENENWINLKLNPDKSASESIAKIEAAFKKYTPSAPFDYKFADEEYAKKFSDEERIGKLAGFFTILAVLISCLGLFGLASFVAEQRTKEIGVRKVLGASVLNLWKLLSKDFIVLVLISCIISAPLAWYFLHNWLQKYTYRTGISWWVFAAAFAGALIITLLTVSFQSIKAALMNPVKSLRTE